MQADYVKSVAQKIAKYVHASLCGRESILINVRHAEGQIMSQNVTTKKKRKVNANAFRNQKILMEAAKGKTQSEIADEFRMSRMQVSRILNSDEMKAIVKRGESKIHEMVDKALLVIEKALDSVDEKLAAEIAVRITKSVGALKDKVDISHSYPKPTVIVKKDGTRVVMGGKSNEEDEDESD